MSETSPMAPGHRPGGSDDYGVGGRIIDPPSGPKAAPANDHYRTDRSCPYCSTHHLAGPCAASRVSNDPPFVTITPHRVGYTLTTGYFNTSGDTHSPRRMDQGGRLRGGWLDRFLRSHISRLTWNLSRQLEVVRRWSDIEPGGPDRRGPQDRDTPAGPERM
jgi:hypothetical protein